MGTGRFPFDISPPGGPVWPPPACGHTKSRSGSSPRNPAVHGGCRLRTAAGHVARSAPHSAQYSSTNAVAPETVGWGIDFGEIAHAPQSSQDPAASSENASAANCACSQFACLEPVIENFARSVYPTLVKTRVQDTRVVSCTLSATSFDFFEYRFTAASL